MDAVLKGMEARGWSVEMTAPTKRRQDSNSRWSNEKFETSHTGVRIGDSFVKFGIEEEHDVVTIPPPPPPPAKKLRPGESPRYVYTPPPQTVHRPNGILSLHVRDFAGHGLRLVVRDGVRKNLEDQLNDFILIVLRASEMMNQQKIERDEYERKAAEEKRQRERVEEENQQEGYERFNLKHRLSNWSKAKEIRAFIDEVEKDLHARDQEIEPSSGAGKRIEWARKFAKRLEASALQKYELRYEPSGHNHYQTMREWAAGDFDW